MAANSIQLLQDKIRPYVEGVREIRRLTEKIDEMKISLPPIDAKICEFTSVLRGYESFKTIDEKQLAKLRKRKQALEENSSTLSDNAMKRASDLENVTFKISQIEVYSVRLETDYEAIKEEIRAAKEIVSSMDNELKHLTSRRDDLFNEISV